MTTHTRSDRKKLAETIREAIDGQVIQAGDEAFPGATGLWSDQSTSRPAIVARVATAVDVQRVLRETPPDVPVTVRGQGHDWAGRAHAQDGVTIDLSQMRGVEIDRQARTARVQGGARLEDLVDAAAEHGLAAAVGTVNEVGAVGLTLGGGYGPYLGTRGLAADNIVSAEIVLADGSIVVASDDENPSLLWALRGGGGNFGVVTTLEITLTELPVVLAGPIAFSTEEIRPVLTALNDLYPAVPDELSIAPAITSGPDGNPMLLVSVNWQGDATEGTQWVQEIEQIGMPLMSEVHPVTPAQALHSLDGMFPAGRQYTLRTISLSSLNPAVVEALAEGERRRISPLTAVNIHHFHGAATRPDAAHSPWALREPHFMVELIATTPDAEGHDAEVAWAERLLSELQAHGLPAAYPNLLPPADITRAGAAFGDNLARLHAVKGDVDPSGRFSAVSIGLPDH
ncbi:MULTISPECIES: FAD-binding oxidoreductase [unclassified Microbacterium]|uniref:FAD-binding oxidoreductase n=1 Tax=unclassified Microbacterium TaxID=2609290 RepID=UPI000EA854C0|nr:MULTISPECIES: FAD-binding oxidoreductase [unclassified Microbacterium]MBT2486434.1 FAD-binding oxidoreductase [Microbacterium sp. ISL-108]RKN69134.1 FAD-binding oxidoreductase [Microbacterium sp. CGR2]